MFSCPSDDLQYIESHLGVSVEKLRNKIIFMTGVTGFIGKNLLECFVWLNKSQKLNLVIYAISRNPENFFKEYPHFRGYSEFCLSVGDIRDNRILFPGPHIDFLIHAAADVINQKSFEDVFSTCVEGTSNILKFAKRHGCKNFLLLSSGAIYGRQPQNLAAIPEKYIGGINLSLPQSSYALGKQCSEWLVQQHDSMNIQVARCFAFVGPHLPLNQHFAIGNFIQAALLGENIIIRGDGTPIRTYLYTADLCLWLVKLILDGKNKKVWNIGGSEAISIKELAELVRQELNPSININTMQPTGLEIEKYVPDITQIEREFKLKPGFSLGTMIKKTALWNLNQGVLNKVK